MLIWSSQKQLCAPWIREKARLKVNAESKRCVARGMERVPAMVLRTWKAPAGEGNCQSLHGLDWTLPGQKFRLELRSGLSLELVPKLAMRLSLTPQSCHICRRRTPLDISPNYCFYKSGASQCAVVIVSGPQITANPPGFWGHLRKDSSYTVKASLSRDRQWHD